MFRLNQAGVSGLTHASRGQLGHRRHDEYGRELVINICRYSLQIKTRDTWLYCYRLCTFRHCAVRNLKIQQ